jgi:hypothetical protein
MLLKQMVAGKNSGFAYDLKEANEWKGWGDAVAKRGCILNKGERKANGTGRVG